MSAQQIEVQETKELVTNHKQTRLGKMMSFEWIGQTLASFFWIISVFAYGGPEGLGDWLQLMAASSWMLSNIASVLTIVQDTTQLN